MKKTIHHQLVGNKLPRKWPHWLSACGSFILTKRGWRVEGELINDKKSDIGCCSTYVELGFLYRHTGGVCVKN